MHVIVYNLLPVFYSKAILQIKGIHCTSFSCKFFSIKQVRLNNFPTYFESDLPFESLFASTSTYNK